MKFPLLAGLAGLSRAKTEEIEIPAEMVTTKKWGPTEKVFVAYRLDIGSSPSGLTLQVIDGDHNIKVPIIKMQTELLIYATSPEGTELKFNNVSANDYKAFLQYIEITKTDFNCFQNAVFE